VSCRRLALALCAAGGALIAHAAPAHAGFDDVLRALQARYHLHESNPLLFGLVGFAVRIAHPEGVVDLQLATFEHQRPDDSEGVAAILRAHAGEGFQPIVQTWSRRHGDCSLIYAHPQSDGHVAMLIFSQDGDDTVLLRVVVSPEAFMAAVKKPSGVAADLR
jgi:hypothetical protein